MTLGAGKRALALLPLTLTPLLTLVLLLGLTHPDAAVAAGAPAAPGLRSEEGYTATSPDGSLQTSVSVHDGRLTYQVVRDGATTVVAPSGLGFVLSTPDVDLTSGMRITSVDRDEIDETWTPAWGTSSSVRDHAEELTVHALQESSGVRLDVVFRVFDDGVGFRYHFPEQEALGDRVVVADESSQFSLPADLTAYYLQAGRDSNADEKHYQTVPLSDVATAQTPITTSRADGLFITVHEADLTDFPSMTLRRDDAVPGRLVSDLISLPDGTKAVLDLGRGGFDTPWRTLTVGREAGDLAESHLIENLNDPCAVCDVDSDDDGVDDTADWIVPATYTGVWWELQRRATTWDAGPKHGATTARTEDYIDLAADAGAKFVLAEGWNHNAGGTWADQDFTTPQDDFDLDEVLEYAASRGVGFIAHNETRGFVDYYDQNLERIFSTYEALGIHAIKTGYATKFLLGGINRSHYDQEAVRHYQRVIETAARHHITVDAHESIKPTGLARTYPNMMTGEGVAGMEQQNYKGANGNPPEQATILPFTRFMGGPADYTPGVLNVTWDPGNLKTRVQTTVAAQLALYTTFYSPMNMLADTPENYAANPEAYAYLKDMPTTWDQSEVSAVIGDHTVTARRSGSTWYVGTVTDEHNRTVPVPLDFLAPDTTYVAEIWSDAAGTTWKGNPQPVEVSRSLVTADSEVLADVVGGGGQAMRLSVADSQEQAELPVYQAPSATVVGAPRVQLDAPNGTVVLDVDVRNDGSTVGPVTLSVDGEPAGPAVRIAAGSQTTLHYRLDADDVPYPGPSTIAVEDGAGHVGAGVEVSLLPTPDADDRRTLTDLIASGDVRAEAATALTAYLARSTHRLARGDFAGVQRGMQGLRLSADAASVDDVSDPARAAVDTLTEPYLGEATGVFSVLRALRGLDGSGELGDDVVVDLRDEASTAAVEAITGAEDAARERLAALRTRVAELGESGPALTAVAASLEALEAQLVAEAETATLVGGASISKEHPGYTGTGFARDLTKAGAGVRFTPTVPDGQTYDVAFRYANGMVIEPLDRQLSLSVDDADLGKVAFPNTGQDADRWRRWTLAPAGTVTLAEGQHALTLSWTGNDTGNVNVDHLELIASLGVIEDAAVSDLTAPEVTTMLDPTPSGDWSAVPVTVAATSTDAVDPDPELDVRVDDGAWGPYDEPVRVSGNGLHTVSVRSEDSSGNAGEPVVREVGIDGAAPSVRFAYDARSRTVRLIAHDRVSGVARHEYRIDSGAWHSYHRPISLPGRAGASVKTRVTDRAGNTVRGELHVPRAPKDRISAKITVTNGSRGRDVVRVLGPRTVRGATVRLYRVQGRRLVRVATTRADGHGNARFSVRDRSRGLTRYRARIASTATTRGDWTPTRSVP